MQELSHLIPFYLRTEYIQLIQENTKTSFWSLAIVLTNSFIKFNIKEGISTVRIIALKNY